MDKIFYLAQIFEGLHTLFCLLLIFTAVIGGIALIFGACATADGDSTGRKILKIAYKFLIATFVSALGVIFIPSKQTYLFMVGGKVVEDFIENNPQSKQIPGNTLDLINEYIKTETEEIRNRNKPAE